MNMRSFVNVFSLQIAKQTICKLAKLKPKLISERAVGDGYSEIRRTVGNSLLDPDDTVGALLKDGDFVMIGRRFLCTARFLFLFATHYSVL